MEIQSRHKYTMRSNLGMGYQARDENMRVVVKWSACSPSTPTIRVQIPLKPTIFSVILYLKRTKINKKESGVGPLIKKTLRNG